MMIFAFQLSRAGAFAGPARLFLLLLMLCLGLPAISAQQKNRSKRISDSILGIKIGTSLVEAHEKLERFGQSSSREGEREEEQEEAGEHKEAWRLTGTEFSSIALKANREGRVVWVTGFVRPGQEISFGKLGDLSEAYRANESQAVWNVETPGGGYRLVGKGQGSKARVVYLLSVHQPPIQ